VILNNTQEITPEKKFFLKWRETFVLNYHPKVEEVHKMFTVTLNEHFKGGSKVVGKERTFTLDQFDSTKIYDLNVDFKKNFKEKTKGNVLIRLQYIKNVKKQLREAINNLTVQKKHYYGLLKFALEKIKYLRQNSGLADSSLQNGGWYNNTDSALPGVKKSKTVQNRRKSLKTFIEEGLIN
jgi:1,2-phenylacetyl-CoA epoxidase catalytic subunit